MGIVNRGAYPRLGYREPRRGLDTSEGLARPVRSVWGGFPETMAAVRSGALPRQAHTTSRRRGLSTRNPQAHQQTTRIHALMGALSW
jgi:hypothetical protein